MGQSVVVVTIQMSEATYKLFGESLDRLVLVEGLELRTSVQRQEGE